MTTFNLFTCWTINSFFVEQRPRLIVNFAISLKWSKHFFFKSWNHSIIVILFSLNTNFSSRLCQASLRNHRQVRQGRVDPSHPCRDPQGNLSGHQARPVRHHLQVDTAHSQGKISSTFLSKDYPLIRLLLKLLILIQLDSEFFWFW